MTKKEKFIELVDDVFNHIDIQTFIEGHEEYQEAIDYFEEMKAEKAATPLTENGQRVLDYIKENYQQFNNRFTAKEIADGMGISAKSVSGSMRKLVSDGYCSKQGKDPVTYSFCKEN